MCDTLVALGNSTEDGSVIFGKNSDRPNDEAQIITYSPRKRYSKNELLKCTYISIPQVYETNTILLSQPWWLWGCESGCNEYGVVIGNEAVYTYEPIRKMGLLGMDLVRLGLERATTAKESLSVITQLLERFHQGGGCAYGDPSWTYHNSFLIADKNEAFVLETADDWWIAEKVKDIRSITNNLSIRGKGDIRKEGIIQHAIEKGYCKDDDNFDFALTFSGSIPSESPFSRGGRSTLLLHENKGKITSLMMMNFLKNHEGGICMHGGFESTGSQISQLKPDNRKSIHWFTGSTLPCLSLYKPYCFPLENFNILNPGPYQKIETNWFWSKHAKFIKNNFSVLNKKEYQRKLKDIQMNLISKLEELNDTSNKVFLINKKAWDKSMEIIK